MNFNILVSYSFIVAGIIIIVKFVQILLLYLITINQWKEVKGKIVKYEIVSDNKEVDYYGWGRSILYEYQIDGKKYSNNVISKNLRISLPFEESAVYFYGNNYKEGDEINVYYNPKKFTESILENKFNPNNLLYILLGVVSIVIGLTI